jgi:ABC-type amino acid transport substrate-binding protein
VPPGLTLEDRIARHLPGTTTAPVDDARAALAARDVDAVLLPLVEATFAAALDPHVSPVCPEPGLGRVPFGFAVARARSDLLPTINQILSVYRENGDLAHAHDRWLTGGEAPPRPPRWSVVRDVLGVLE